MSIRYATIVIGMLTLVLTGCKTAPLRTFGEGGIRALVVAVSPDGQLVAAGGNDGTIRVFDARSGRELARQTGFNSADPVQSHRIAFSPDSTRLAFAGGNNSCLLWSWFSKDAPTQIASHANPVRQICFAPDGARLLTASGGFGVDASGSAVAAPLRIVCSYLDDGHELARIDDPPGVLAVGFSRSGELLATARAAPERMSGAAAGTGLLAAQLAVRSIRTGQTQQVADADDAATALCFSPDQQLLLCGTSVWDCQTGLRMKQFDDAPCAFVDARTVLVLKHGRIDGNTAWFQPIWVDVWSETTQRGEVILHDGPEIASVLPGQFMPDFAGFVDQNLRHWKLPANAMAGEARKGK